MEPNPEKLPAPVKSKSWRHMLRAGLQSLASADEAISFSELYRIESERLDHSRKSHTPAGATPASAPTIKNGPANEPAIAFTPHDRFGLALSGGGIRSATFNLGVLQSLARLQILPHVDYLATVSGGGYVGGFWSTWLHRRKKNSPDYFPASAANGTEQAEIRHLREFSRFLLPRLGVIHTEFWAIVMTVLGGMLPSLVAGFSVLTIAWYVWVIGMIALAFPGLQGAASPLALILYLGISEFRWRNAGRAERSTKETVSYAVAGLVAAFIFYVRISANPYFPDVDAWKSFTYARNSLAIPKVLAITTLVMLFARVAAARFFRRNNSLQFLVGLERCVIRMVGLTFVLLALAGLWIAGTALGDLQLKVTAGSAVVSAGFFAWTKNWLAQPVQETRGDTFLNFFRPWIKRATPKLLAGFVWLLLFVLVAAALNYWGTASIQVNVSKFWIPLEVAAVFLCCVAWLFDPARVGMHDFYRARISRCYLGASNPPPSTAAAGAPAGEFQESANRQVAERPGDDITLGQLRDIARPIHLVCVAANEMSGDPLGNLYRGARSAVLSGNGISLGDQTARVDHIRLSSALTASAAAFNSQMGRVSVDLGPAVSFLMTALNLRLGLWVPHPANRFRGSYFFPGRFFLAELLGFSRTDWKNVHLSDGNHFENFGLYELVRRHCRYIIVSDCGEDHQAAFDDLANVLRRLREDFGVEVELDIKALRPDDDRRAKQHAVIGTIHYDGLSGTDKGTLLFLKPMLTGDEPPDVLQYATRNKDFPQEGTGNQFYHEAQWESYRRLGEHSIESMLGFFEAPPTPEINVPDRLFRDARSRWRSTPEDISDNFIQLNERCADLEQELMVSGPEHLREEFFAEATALLGKGAKGHGKDDAKEAAPALSDELQTLGFLVRVGQIMEDMFVGADLQHTWSDPLHEGWMNYFRRWAATPSFRRWWPVLSSLYGLGVREFVREQFHAGASDPDSTRSSRSPEKLAQLRLRPVDDAAKFFQESFVAVQFLQSRALPDLMDARVFSYDLDLLDYHGELSQQPLSVGFALVREIPAHPKKLEGPRAVTWEVDHLFVPDALYGAGFVSKLLDALLRFYRQPVGPGKTQVVEARVNFSHQEASMMGSLTISSRRPGKAAREERVRELEFYKSRGFSYISPENAATGAIRLRVIL